MKTPPGGIAPIGRRRKSSRTPQTTSAMKEYLQKLKRKRKELSEVNSDENVSVKRRRKTKNELVKKLPHSNVKKRMLKIVRNAVQVEKGGNPMPGLFLPNQSMEGSTEPVVYGKHVYTHVINLGGNPPLYECKTCKQRFKSWVRVRIHQTCVTGKYRFNCTVCGSGWHSKSEYERHVTRRHKKPKNVSCQHCGENFKCEFDWAEHVQQIHKGRGEHVPFVNGRRRVFVNYKKTLAKTDKLESGKDRVDDHRFAGLKRNCKSRFGKRAVEDKKAIPIFYRIVTGSTNATRPLIQQRTYSIPEIPQFQCKLCDKAYRWKCSLAKHILLEHPDPKKSPRRPYLHRKISTNSSKITSLQQDYHDNQLSNHDDGPPELEQQIPRLPVAESHSSSSSDEIDVVGIDDEVEITTDIIELSGIEDNESEENRSVSDAGKEPVTVNENYTVVEVEQEEPLAINTDETQTEETRKELALKKSMKIFASVFSRQGLANLRLVLSNEVEPYPF